MCIQMYALEEVKRAFLAECHRNPKMSTYAYWNTVLERPEQPTLTTLERWRKKEMGK